MPDKQTVYTIQFTGGGPLDGYPWVSSTLPVDGTEITHEGHSYCFRLAEWRFEYMGLWRSLELGTSVSLVYRTYGEALRQLGKLQFLGVITASESLDIQARIKKELRHYSLEP